MWIHYVIYVARTISKHTLHGGWRVLQLVPAHVCCDTGRIQVSQIL